MRRASVPTARIPLFAIREEVPDWWLILVRGLTYEGDPVPTITWWPLPLTFFPDQREETWLSFHR